MGTLKISPPDVAFVAELAQMPGVRECLWLLLFSSAKPPLNARNIGRGLPEKFDGRAIV